jgi:ketosteroid isomerase-like protein
MADDAVAVVQRYLEALRRMDPEAMFAEISDEEFVLELPFAPEGMPKRVETKQGLIEFFGPVAAGLWKELEFPTLEVRGEADPSRVIAEYTSKGTFANGAPYAQTYVNLCRVRNGKIVYSAEFFDPAALAPGLVPPA